MTNSTTPGYPSSNDASFGADDSVLGGSTTGAPGAAGTTSTTGTTGVTGTTGTPGTTFEAPTPGPREEAANLAQEAGDAGRRVAGTAKEETKAVGWEARRQARRLADQVGTEVRQQAATQQSRAASGLRNIGDEFSSMANGTGSGSGFAADLARQAGDRVGAAAQWLDERDPRALVEEVKGFARRRPGVFIGIAVGAGVVVGRLVRALAQPSDDDGDAARGSLTSGSRRGTAVGAGNTAGYGTGTAYGAGTAYDTRTGAPATGATVVTGTATDADVDPVTGQRWAEGSSAASRGGI